MGGGGDFIGSVGDLFISPARAKEVKRYMAYSFNNSKGQTYYLHSRDVTLKNGRQQRIYYFAREVRSGAMDAVPAGYSVMETKRTGMPVLKKG